MIQKVLEESKGSPAETAIAVCLLLEDTIDLRGNGWFDDDEVMDFAFKKEYEEWQQRRQSQ